MRNLNYHVFFSNLSNKLKMDIIFLLREKEKKVSDLVKSLKVEQSKISHALASLRCYKIVKCRQNGKERIYSLNKETIIPILRVIDKNKDKFCVDLSKVK